MKKIGIVVLLLAVVLLFSSQAFAQKKPVIGFIVTTMDNEFYVTMVNAAKMEAKAQNVKLIVQAGLRHGSVEDQLRIFEDMLTREVDAICVVAASLEGLISVLGKAEKAKIPVVNPDVRISPEAVKKAGLKPVPYIGSSNFDASYSAGQYAIEKMKISGNIAVLTGVLGAANARLRRDGFRAAAEKLGAGKVKIVAQQTANWEVEQGYNVFQNMLQANPDITFLFGSNDNMALGAIRAIKEAGKQQQIKVVGFDAIPGALQAIKDGTMVASVAQYPAEMGHQSVQAALKLIKGQSVPEETFVKTEVIDKSNVDEFLKYLEKYK
jgi:ribose transport system substrate-binding protein